MNSKENIKKTLSPLERYRQDLETPGFVADTNKRKPFKTGAHLSPLPIERPQDTGVMAWVKSKLDKSKPEPVRGLSGEGSRGKTHVVARSMMRPFDNKMRIHFHRFMQRVHAELKTLSGREPTDVRCR